MSKVAGRLSFILSTALLCAFAAGPALASDVSEGLKHYNQGIMKPHARLSKKHWSQTKKIRACTIAWEIP